MAPDTTRTGSAGAPCVVHLDLDGARHIYRAHGWTYAHEDDPLYESGLSRALDFFDEERVQATLFLVAEDLDHPRRRALLNRALESGHEIASHTWTHRRLSALDPTEREREVTGSRERIETVLDVEVRGFRAPAFDLDRDGLETIARAGYAYDSSILPNADHARRMGLDAPPRGPFLPFPGEDFAELPLPGYRPLPFPAHPSYALVMGEWYFRLGLSRASETDPLVLLFHLTDFAAPVSTARRVPERLFTISHRSQRAKVEACRRMLRATGERRRFTTTNRLLNEISSGPSITASDRP